MWECVNALVGLIGKMSRGIEKGRRETVEGPPKNHQPLGLKISSLSSCLVRTRNALVFRRYVIATKKAQRRHKEPTKKGERMRECGNVVIIHFCVYCENIDAFCEIDVWENGCNFAASNETNKN